MPHNDAALMFTVGEAYTRNDVYYLLGLSQAERGGDWLNGYHRHKGDYFIFCNIGVAGRTGHHYDNHWEGERLVWFGKTKSHFTQASIQDLISGEYRVLIFYRSDDRAPFTFAGVGHGVPRQEIEFPVRIDWTFGADEHASTSDFTDELIVAASFEEGHRTQVLVNRYERDHAARTACIRHHGAKCCICSLDFGERYGAIGRGFIHVHHIVPLSQIGAGYTVNPIKDLVPVCPNCHAMIHRRKPPLSIAELRGSQAHRG
jgi:5-methylcytosine-specific restriction protein A